MRQWIRAAVACGCCAVGLPASADVLEYERDVRPILAGQCFSCHGAEMTLGGLRLDVKADVLKGGASGKAAVTPGNSVGSRLIEIVEAGHPNAHRAGASLQPEQILLLKRWIDAGAHWATEGASAPPDAAAVVVPEKPVTPEDRAFWSFTPPRSVEPPQAKDGGWPRNRIDRFVAARLEAAGLKPAPEAPPNGVIRRLSYDLLGLPPTPEEVDAFLADREPQAYERLVERLLASPRFGERMASLWLPLARYAEDQAHQVGTDTKFFYPHAWKYRQWVIDAFNRDLPYDRFVAYQVAADQVEGAGREDLAALGFLGLGPKYYDRKREAVLADEWEDRVDTVTRTMLGLTVACARCHDHKFDPVSQADYYALAGVFASTRMVNKTPEGAVQQGELEAEKVDPAALHVVEDGEARNLNVFLRGDVERQGPPAPRRFVRVLSAGEPAPFQAGSGRKELALAIAGRANPLTARVMVNRVWGMLFGAPLVATPSNFGRSGQPPTHPELLDDLAVRFMDNGWSLKWLVREIATSATYRQSAGQSPSDAASDPSNALLGRTNRRRLTVEQWRDGVLFVAGRLDATGGGPSPELDDPANRRRTVYARISRLKLNDLLMQFDYPDANVHAESRSVTNTPVQKLFMLNSPFVMEQAKALAARVNAEAPNSNPDRIRRAYRMLFSRDPAPEELALGSEFLEVGSDPARRWEQYAQMLLASNEALYVD